MIKTFAFLSHLDLNLYLFRLPIMKELLKRGHRVLAICPKGDKNEVLKENGIEVVNYEIERDSLNPLKEIKTIERIYSAIKDLQIDLLHTFTTKPNIYGTIAAKKASIPTVLNLVEGLGSFYTRNTFKTLMVRKMIEQLYKKAFTLSDSCVFVNSDDSRYMYRKGLIPKEKIKIIKSVGVDIDKFSMQNYPKNRVNKIKEKLGLEGKIVVLMVGRAIWDKGIKEYYEASSYLKKRYKNVEFLFVGDIDKGNPTSVSRKFLKSGAVKWLGLRDDIVELTAISDIYVLPSYREGVPRTLLEAASMSKPIVTTDTVGCKEVVDDGVNGFLVPIKNAKSLAQKIEILIDDKELREKMGQESRKKAVNEFDIKIVTEKYLKLYREFIDV